LYSKVERCVVGGCCGAGVRKVGEREGARVIYEVAEENDPLTRNRREVEGCGHTRAKLGVVK
jgi:hypothetical protein